MDEATRMRNTARHNLLQEERSASAETFQKEKEATEGKRLIIDRRLELERLQKKIFQTGKILAKTEHEGTEENLEETVPTCHPVELMSRQFEVLKKTTGKIKYEFIFLKTVFLSTEFLLPKGKISLLCYY